MIGFMIAKLMLGPKPIMPIEQSIVSWVVLPWKQEVTRQDLITLRIRQLERRSDDVDLAAVHLKQS